MTILAYIAVQFAYGNLDKKSMEKLTFANEEIEYDLTKKPNKEQVIIMANYKIDVPNFKFFGVDELLELVSLIEDGKEYQLNNCILCLDEIWSIIESRISGAKLARLFSYFIFQSGKSDVQILYSAQLNSTADLRLRNLSNISIKCRKDKKRQRFIYSVTTDTGATYEKILTFAKAEQFYPLYDTKFKIPLSSIQISRALKEKALKRKQKLKEEKLEKKIMKK